MKTSYEFRRVTAINSSFDNKYSHPGRQPRPVCSTTTGDQLLNYLLFSDLLYFVTDNNKVEPNSTIWCSTWTKGTIANTACVRAARIHLKESKCLVIGGSQVGTDVTKAKG